ncbi:MAG: hypothetical protein OEW60_08870 [Thiovulaceae bacterium]|nr:hypothetical protein [Sulfurimonadaceae bacterium]
MKKLLLIFLLAVSSLFATTSTVKKGFLTTKTCADQGTFVDCNLESYKTNDLVLFVHEEGKYYKVKAKEAKVVARLDKAFSRNDITLHTNSTSNDTLHVNKVEMAEIKKGPIFKGCL